MKLTPVRYSLLWTISQQTNQATMSSGVLEKDDSASSEIEDTPLPSAQSLSESHVEDREEDTALIDDDDELHRQNNRVFGVGDMEYTPESLVGPSNLIFRSRLRKYQLVAYAWMKQREKPHAQSATMTVCSQEDNKRASPIWDEFALPPLPIDWHDSRYARYCSETSLYINHMSGVMSFEHPNDSSGSRGGILADQMGLGKTVETLAVMADDIDPRTLKRVWRSSERAGTLIIVPLSLMAQWYQEIQRHFDVNA
eukprot:Gregarina_sp_Poly_1__1212@NODE_1299_length_4435_cov_13_644231_g879_i0_p4_GENE_NODE_1299_length_4435_cov_13_644231_g879_i0NODE_1299_length_4435_cov_13_644231_g879_i0_p4_ORF_typecomplete_len254_score36_03SNF2_N/PF00176_23/1_1e18ResIII/PF04851_15/0_00022_NODE_1299_length_4435_cov_13_644231_g879_i024393200